MKITKTASGKRTIKISKTEWETMGKQAGWSDIKPSMKHPRLEEAQNEMWDNVLKAASDLEIAIGQTFFVAL